MHYAKKKIINKVSQNIRFYFSLADIKKKYSKLRYYEILKQKLS